MNHHLKTANIKLLISHKTANIYQIIDLTQYGKKYRVNYTHSLPSTEVIARAISQAGKGLLSQYKYDCFTYIHWAKTGRKSSLLPEELVQDSRRLAIIRPTSYNKIISPDEIQRGDHLIWFKNANLLREHVLVTECKVNNDPLKFKVICCSETKFKEDVRHFTLSMGVDIYRINYIEASHADIAVSRSHSKLKEHNYRAHARMDFVRWAKTGSNEGLEVDFLKNNTRPITKSKISCFTQLNPGDYIVAIHTVNRHFLVVSVESPYVCTAYESYEWCIRKIPLEWIRQGQLYYRVNYENGVCISPEQAIEEAKKLDNTSIMEKKGSKYGYQSFVHYLKTGEEAQININDLQDDRFFLQREKITSATDLMPGDHIERPLGLPIASDHAQHHMLVVESVDDKYCKVIHYKVFPRLLNKGDVVFEEVDIFKKNEVFRIRHPECIDPEKGIKKLRQLCMDKQKGKDTLKELTGMVW